MIENKTIQLGFKNACYKQVRAPKHPRARNGMIAEHILIIEKKLGRFVKLPEVVHHIDGNKWNNNPDNLYLCMDRAHHMGMHHLQRRNQMLYDLITKERHLLGLKGE